MGERIGLYAGSFDPPTFGHLDLIERAAKLFDRLLVAVAYNNQKVGLFTVSITPNDLQIDLIKVVFPTPSSPSNNQTLLFPA